MEPLSSGWQGSRAQTTTCIELHERHVQGWSATVHPSHSPGPSWLHRAAWPSPEWLEASTSHQRWPLPERPVSSHGSRTELLWVLDVGGHLQTSDLRCCPYPARVAVQPAICLWAGPRHSFHRQGKRFLLFFCQDYSEPACIDPQPPDSLTSEASVSISPETDSFVVVQSLSHVRLFVTPQTAAHQAPPSSTISQSLLKFTSIESVMPSNHLILCYLLLLLASIFPSIRVFSSE